LPRPAHRTRARQESFIVSPELVDQGLIDSRQGRVACQMGGRMQEFTGPSPELQSGSHQAGSGLTLGRRLLLALDHWITGPLDHFPMHFCILASGF